MRLRVVVYAALTLAGCHSGRASQAQVAKAWKDAALAGFFPMSPICEKVEGVAARRLSKAYDELGRLAAIAAKSYPGAQPYFESPANAMCDASEDLPGVGTSNYVQQETEATTRASQLESSNAKFAAALGE